MSKIKCYHIIYLKCQKIQPTYWRNMRQDCWVRFSKIFFYEISKFRAIHIFLLWLTNHSNIHWLCACAFETMLISKWRKTFSTIGDDFNMLQSYIKIFWHFLALYVVLLFRMPTAVLFLSSMLAQMFALELLKCLFTHLLTLKKFSHL